MQSIPEQIGHYTILQRIAQGGMGEVYLAQDTHLNRRVALKFISHTLLANQDARERFLREARAAALLNHPNIVTIYDIDDAGGFTYIAMEYVEGVSLKKFIAEKEEGRPPAKALEIAVQIAAGIGAAHAAGVIHRDIKSDNILIDQKGRVKILDFGLAKLMTDRQLTQTMTQMGTPAYMSPEQVLGKASDPRADIFSFGVVLYELFTGCLPFAGDNEIAIVYAILNQPPKPIEKSKREHLPPQLFQLIHKMLEKNVKKRFQSADAVLIELQKIHQQMQQGDFAQKKRMPSLGRITSAAGFAVFFLGILFLILRLTSIFDLAQNGSIDGGSSAETIALLILPFEIRGGSTYDYLSDGMVDLLSTKLDGAGRLRCVDARAVLSYLHKKNLRQLGPEQAKSISEKFNARFYILGNIIEIGRHLYFSASLYDRSHPEAPIAQASVDAPPENIFVSIDDLASQLITNILEGPGYRLRQLAAMTTNSLPALKAYLQGESQFRAGQYTRALASFQQAVAQDTAFALAYYRLSFAADWLTRPALASQAAIQAAKHSRRLSERDRALLQALRAWQTGNAAEAERLYRIIVGTYPEDAEAWFQLGEVLFHFGPLQGRSVLESRKPFLKVCSLEPEHVPSLVHLARIAARARRMNRLDSLTRAIRRIQPQGERLLEILSLQAFSGGTDRQKKEMLARLGQANDLVLALATWNVATYSPARYAAKSIAGLLAEPSRSPEARVLGGIFQAHLEMMQGRYRRAQQILGKIQPLDPVTAGEYRVLFSLLPFLPESLIDLQVTEQILRNIRTLPPITNVTPNVFFTVHNGRHREIQTYLWGLLHIRNSQDERARKLANRLIASAAAIGARHQGLARDFNLSIRANLAFRRGDYAAAQQLYNRMQINSWYGLMATSPFFSRALDRFMLAETLYRLGWYQQAIVAFRSFEESCIFDLPYMPIAHLRQAQLYEKLAQPQQAAHHYRKFISHWQNSEAAFQSRVAQARQRLEALAESVDTQLNKN